MAGRRTAIDNQRQKNPNQRQNAKPTCRNIKGVNFTIVMTTAELEMLEINRNA